MVSSARNPNESYAERAKKASTSTSRTTPQKLPPALFPNHVFSPTPKPPQVNVWAERIKEQRAHAPSHHFPQTALRASSSPQPTPDDAIQLRSSPPDLSVQLAILDQQDEHDPFVVRVPPHLSRQSSSSTNPHPATDTWPHLPVTDRQSNASSAGYDSPFLSAAPSRQNSTASFRHHAYSSAGSVRLSRVQSSLSHHSHSASQSREPSRSGSSASSPRLQIRGRTLPHDDSLPPDLRLDHHHRKLSNQRSSPALPDPPNNMLVSLQTDSIPPADPYHRRPLVPPLQDMPSHYTHHLLTQYALTQQFSPTHVPGHTSPSYIPSHSGQGTPPYPHYPSYPAYMYGHPSLFWGEAPPPHSHTHFKNQSLIPSNYINASDHAVPHITDLSPAITIDSGAPKDAARTQNGWQPRPCKNVVFGTINLADSQTGPSTLLVDEEQRTESAVEHATEQFSAFSIGVGPNEPGPSHLASRNPSVRSLSKTLFSQPTTNDANDANPPSRGLNGIKKPIKWEFGTTHSEDLDDSLSQSSSPTSLPLESGSDNFDVQPDLINVAPSHTTSQADHSTDKSETESPASDVWVVKDYGYGFGDHTGSGNAPDVARLGIRDREKAPAREIREHHDRGLVPGRQSSWRHEKGNEEQQIRTDVPRHMRPRRGSFPGYGGNERGGFTARRGRGFGGRFHGGRGRGGFFHHQRPASYPFAPPPPPPAPPAPPLSPFEMFPPGFDLVNGYGQPPYAPLEVESYESVPQQPAQFTPPTYTLEAMRNCLLGQLEYYLSPQNMAQDLYLRQRMDNEGWIPISLLASFKRVQQLHTDTDIVREVLSRSKMVEVSGDWVRMGGRQWDVFVLPNAPRSMVTGLDRGEGQSATSGHYPDIGAYMEPTEIEGEHGETEGEDCEGDDEDDDIEFVIGEEAEGSWMSVTERKQ